MKAISLWQPWASLLVAGLKKVETRSWYTGYRGSLLIHAAKKKDAEIRDYIEDYFCDELLEIFKIRDESELIKTIPFGALIGYVELDDCKTTEALVNKITQTEFEYGNYAPERFGWICKNAQAFQTPIPYKGKQGFFNVSMTEELELQLNGAGVKI